MRRSLNAPHIPLQRTQMQRALARQFGKPEVFEPHGLPRRIDHGRDSLEPAPTELRTHAALGLSVGEGLAERLGLDGAHRHALPVDGVEAADRVTKGDQFFWEAAELLIPPQTADKAEAPDLRQGLTVGDRLVDVWHGK